MRICASCGGGYIGGECDACRFTALPVDVLPVLKKPADVMLSEKLGVFLPVDPASAHEHLYG